MPSDEKRRETTRNRTRNRSTNARETSGEKSLSLPIFFIWKEVGLHFVLHKYQEKSTTKDSFSYAPPLFSFVLFLVCFSLFLVVCRPVDINTHQKTMPVFRMTVFYYASVARNRMARSRALVRTASSSQTPGPPSRVWWRATARHAGRSASRARLTTKRTSRNFNEEENERKRKKTPKQGDPSRNLKGFRYYHK